MLSRFAVAALIASILVSCSVDGAGASSEGHIFRPPAVPLFTFAPMQQKFLLNEDPSNNTAMPSYWTGDPMRMNVLLRFSGRGGDNSAQTFSLLGNGSTNDSRVHRASPRRMVRVRPTVTTFFYRIAPNAADVFDVELNFTNPLLLDNLTLASIPVGLLSVSVSPKSPSIHDTVQLYVDADATNCIHLKDTEVVDWDPAPAVVDGVAMAKMGTVSQRVLGSEGDWFMLDWGHMYLGVLASDGTGNVSVALGDDGRSAFVASGLLPPHSVAGPRNTSARDPRIPTLAAVAWARLDGGAASIELDIAFGYDDVSIVDYFGEPQSALWRESGHSMEQVFAEQLNNGEALKSQCDQFDELTWRSLSEKLGEEYAHVTSIAYRQTVAAVQFGARNVRGDRLAFMKEISSDGNINTVDVIFPAAPLFLYFEPEVLWRLLLPVLQFASNQTSHLYGDPDWCPHQIGNKYPMANSTTKSQEPMPLEETANMFLMLATYVQAVERNSRGSNSSARALLRSRIAPYYKMLERWAWWVIDTQLPIPPYQLCTDDFTGPLAQNANLAAKGVISVAAFGKLCQFINDRGDCSGYFVVAREFAESWLRLSFAESRVFPGVVLPHTKRAFNLTNDTWSTKYNLVWQQLLEFDNESEVPFRNFDAIAKMETTWYERMADRYGWPLNGNMKCQKADWMTWASSLTASRADFQRNFGRIYSMFNTTTSRVPLTDLFFIGNATQCLFFRSRPVVGALYAPMLIPFRP